MLFSKCPIAERAQKDPSGLAVIVRDTSYSNEAYHHIISNYAASLKFSQGDRVGICAADSFEQLCLLQALFRRGMIATPINPRLPPDTIAQIIDQLNLSTLYTDSELNIKTSIPLLPLSPPHPPSASHLPPSTYRLSPSSPAIIVLTSGSTSTPKAAVHTITSLSHNAHGANTNMPLGRESRWLLSLPLHHVSGLGILFRTAISGAVIVLDDQHKAVDALREHSITHVSMVASQLMALIESWENQGPIPSLKAVLAGGSGIAASLITRAVDLGIPLHVSYGSTEMGSQITTTETGANQKQMNTSGKLLPHRCLSVAPDGEILVKGKTLCAGYWVDGCIQTCIDEQGWVHSGDNGQLDEEDCLTVLGRRDSMFISGGENIYPEEIEAALMELPMVTQAAVVSIPHEIYGERPAAFIKATEAFDAKAIQHALAKTLPRFKLPDTILPWPTDYPTDGLKVDSAFLKMKASTIMQER